MTPMLTTKLLSNMGWKMRQQQESTADTKHANPKVLMPSSLFFFESLPLIPACVRFCWCCCCYSHLNTIYGIGKISSRCKAKPNLILCLDEKYVRHTRLLNFHSPFKSDNSNKRRIYWDNAHRIHFAATIILQCRKDVENITTTMQMQRVIIIWYTV